MLFVVASPIGVVRVECRRQGSFGRGITEKVVAIHHVSRFDGYGVLIMNDSNTMRNSCLFQEPVCISPRDLWGEASRTDK